MITETKTTRYKRTMCFKQILKHFCVVSFEESSPGHPRRWELVWPCLIDTLSSIFRDGEGVCSFVIYWIKGELKSHSPDIHVVPALCSFSSIFPFCYQLPKVVASCVKAINGNQTKPTVTSELWGIDDRWTEKCFPLGSRGGQERVLH